MNQAQVGKKQTTMTKIGDFAFFPLDYWNNSLYPQTDDTLSFKNLGIYLSLPFLLLATTVTLILGSVAAFFTVLSLPFQYLYNYFNSSENNKIVELENSQPILENVEELEIADDLPIDSQWKDILEFGRWAPSPHNMQPWIFRMEADNSVTLMYDPKRLLPGTNPIGSFMHVSFGILNETLSIAAAHHGLDIDVSNLSFDLDPSLEGPQELATLKLVTREKPETLDRNLILERQTSRLPYNGKQVPQEVLDELSEIAAQYGHKLEFSTEESEVKWVIRLNAETMFFDMSTEETRNEVSSWMRFTMAEAKKQADGLAAYTMNTPGFLMWLFAHANWAFRLPGIYQMVRGAYEKGMAGTPAVAWISGPFEEQKDWDNAGHMMARLWLTMTKHGVYLHPFGSVITNKEAHEIMVDHFKNDEREHDLWMLVRLGYSEAPPRAQRMPLAKMIINGGGFFQPKEQPSANEDIVLEAESSNALSA